MRISVLDGSNYFKGLLLLARKDRKITEEEKGMMRTVGSILGFEKKFVENAIREILENRHISAEPPVFSTKELAEKFLIDGLAIAASDGDIHPREDEWLHSVARSNHVEESWLAEQKETAVRVQNPGESLEVYDITVAY